MFFFFFALLFKNFGFESVVFVEWKNNLPCSEWTKDNKPQRKIIFMCMSNIIWLSHIAWYYFVSIV